MSLRSIDIWMTAGDSGGRLAVARMIESLLGDWLPARVEPLSISGLWNGRTIQHADISGKCWAGIALWSGESDTGGPLTVVRSPQPGLRRQLLEECDGSEVGVRLGGPLRHRPPAADSETAWYGRAKLPAGNGAPAALLDLVQISVEWSAIDHHVVIGFPLSGYPITAVSPVLVGGEAIKRACCPEIVEENQREIFAWIRQLPCALGLLASEVEWEINAEEALFADDIQMLRGRERWLRTG
jgi:hypothetical protein